jgi:hypothetical protein
MQEFGAYLYPFFKNLLILCLTPWIMFLFLTLRRIGLKGFSFLIWLEENSVRFQVGFLLILSLSLAMALTDISPLFKWAGLDINQSPAALGVVLGVLIMVGIPTNPKDGDDKTDKVHDIQDKAQAIIKTSTEIATDDKLKK